MVYQPHQSIISERERFNENFHTPDVKALNDPSLNNKIDIVSYKDKRTEYRRNISKNRDCVTGGKNLLDDLKNIEVMNNVSQIKNRVRPLIQPDGAISNQSFNLMHGSHTCRSKTKERLLFPIEQRLNKNRMHGNVKELVTVKKTNETVKIYSVMNYDTNPKQEKEEFNSQMDDNYECTVRKDSSSSKKSKNKQACDRIKKTMKNQSFAQYFSHNWESVLKKRDPKVEGNIKLQEVTQSKNIKNQKQESMNQALASKK